MSEDKTIKHDQFINDIKKLEILLDYLDTNSIEIFKNAKEALENIKKGSGCPHFSKCPTSNTEK